MKKMIMGGLSVCVLTSGLFAGGDILQQEQVAHNEAETHCETEESNFYVIAKGLTVLGDTVSHEANILDGERGYGFGIDFGYRLGQGFALEYDFTYAKNTVTEIDEFNESEEGNAKYYAHALDLVYTYHVSHAVGLFVKGGYEYETEKIDAFEMDSDDHGFNYGAGLEWSMNDKYALVVEYEKSTIEGPRGDALFAGVMYNF